MLQKTDPQIHKLIQKETKRQDEYLSMIASENYSSESVREALGSILTNKYSEGEPQKDIIKVTKILTVLSSWLVREL